MIPVSQVKRISRVAVLAGLITSCGVFAMAQAGVPVPDDSPLYNSFRALQKLPGYKMHMEMQVNDPRMQQMMASGMGMGAIEKTVKGDTSQVTMHMKVPAFDIQGQVDDWEIKAVAQNGKAARMFSSPAIPRLIKKNRQMLEMQLAMMEKQAGMAVGQALAQGPFGALSAGVAAASTAASMAGAIRMEKQAEEFWNWKCIDQPAATTEAEKEKKRDQLTDLKATGDDTVNGTAASGYEFYVRDQGKLQGPVKLLVAKDGGLPLRIHMTDPEGRGSMDMNYDYGAVGDIEIPACMGK